MERVSDMRYDKSRWILALVGYALLCLVFSGILVLGVSARVEDIQSNPQDPASSEASRFDTLAIPDLPAGNDPSGVTIAARTAVSPGVSISPISISVSEDGVTDTYEVVLKTEPTNFVTINVATDGQTEVDSQTLYFFSNNWDQIQTVIVSAVDDGVPEGQHTSTISHTIDSQGADYGSLDLDDVIATIQDNDGPSINVDPTSLTVSEPNGSAVFTITLTSEPTSSVTIPLSPSNSECSVSPPSIVLTDSNWTGGVTATVTAVDDDVVDGDQGCVVQTGAATSDDAVYHGLDPADVNVTVQDDDVEAGIEVSPTTLTVSEPSGSAAFTIRLTTEPTSSVAISLTTSNSECSISPPSVTLNGGNWSGGVTATITAVDDAVADGDQVCVAETGTTASDDPAYRDLDPADVNVTVQDDDEAGIEVSPTSLTVSEPDGSAAFTITLSSEPTSSVTIPLSTSNSECSVSPTSVMLDDGNWSTGVAATVTAIDDAVDDGDQVCVVQTGMTSSSQSIYHDLNPADVNVTVEDDDAAGIVVSPTSLTVSEPDGSAPFTITLSSEPTSTVTIPLSTSNSECSVSPPSVMLDDSNWTAGVTVTVIATDDDADDDDLACVALTGAASSDDPVYHGLDPADVFVVVQDDEIIWQVYLPLMVHDWPPLPEVPVLQAVSNPDGDSSYPVRWSTALRAESYILQEAKDSTFSGAVQVYAGPATSYDIAGRGAGRHYYRVKAHNGWGDSGWSGTQSVDVVWEAEPNNVPPIEANGPLASNLTYYGIFPSTVDINDYYYFDLPLPGSMELWLRNIPTGQNYDLVLYDASLQSAVGYSLNLGNAEEHILTGILPAARYYVRVYNRGAGASEQSYHLMIRY